MPGLAGIMERNPTLAFLPSGMILVASAIALDQLISNPLIRSLPESVGLTYYFAAFILFACGAFSKEIINQSIKEERSKYNERIDQESEKEAFNTLSPQDQESYRWNEFIEKTLKKENISPDLLIQLMKRAHDFQQSLSEIQRIQQKATETEILALADNIQLTLQAIAEVEGCKEKKSPSPIGNRSTINKGAIQTTRQKT